MEALFKSIAVMLASENSDIVEGKMMSSPGIKYKNKVFAFYYNEKMIFRLGRDFHPKAHGIEQYSLLNPFKNKPPMGDWFEIPSDFSHKWEELSRLALKKIMTSLK